MTMNSKARKSSRPERVVQASIRGFRLAWVECGITVRAGPWKATRYQASKTKKAETKLL